MTAFFLAGLPISSNGIVTIIFSYKKSQFLDKAPFSFSYKSNQYLPKSSQTYTRISTMSNARTNDAWRARIQQGRIYASGSFKNVWEGTYTEGPGSGQRCVAKEFKAGSVYEDHYFEEEMNIIRRSQAIVDDSDAAGVLGNNRRILLNTPSVWTSDLSEQKALVEPMIDNFEKFNSNTGWATNSGGEWAEAMQAVSHFSYHDSRGQILLCDLQGGVYRDG
jgi:hypothetical protein